MCCIRQFIGRRRIEENPGYDAEEIIFIYIIIDICNKHNVCSAFMSAAGSHWPQQLCSERDCSGMSGDRKGETSPHRLLWKSLISHDNDTTDSAERERETNRGRLLSVFLCDYLCECLFKLDCGSEVFSSSLSHTRG